MNNELYIVILNWNGWHDTVSCIESINANKFNIVLVDNGSKEEEIATIQNYLEENFPEYIEVSRNDVPFEEKVLSLKSSRKIGFSFLRNNENLGFAGGNNSGLELVNALGGNFILLLNNDTIVVEDAIERLLNDLISDSKIGAVIPQIRYYNPSDVIWNCGGKISRFGVRKYYYAFENIINTPQNGLKKVDYGTGCCLMFDFKKVGKLSEKFFFGEEDMEFAFRMKRLQLDIICDFEAIIYHKVGASRDQISKNSVGKMVYHYCQRISNLHDNLNSFNWLISLLLHMGSSVRLLVKMKKFSIGTFSKVWKEIVANVNKKKFLKEDFINISNKDY